MPAAIKSSLARSFAAGFLVLVGTAASIAQQRYEPSRPTVSPYLNLFQNKRNGQFNRALPNYYSLVKPQLQQQRVNENQQQLIQQQNNTIDQLQGNVQLLQQQTSQVVTGHSSWFLNTSRYYSKSGAHGQQGGRTQAQSSHSSQSGSSAQGRRR